MKTKLLIVAHPSVLDVNRTIYRKIQDHGDFEIRLLVPESWKGDLIRDLQCEPFEDTSTFKMIRAPIFFSGNGSLYFFKPGWKKRLNGWSPNLIFLDEEPWSLSAFQIYRGFPTSVPKTFFTKQNLKKKLPPPFGWIQRWIFKNSTYAFSVASEVSDVLRWKGFNKTICDLPHSYDPILFKIPTTETKEALKKKYQIPPEKVVISYFGRLTEEKGIADLLEAQKMIQSNGEIKNAYFLWVGNGPLEEMVRKQTPLLPAFPHDQVGNALALSDILVLPSRTVSNWKEQFGRILVEAMACGSAVIGSDSGEIPHLIQRSGGGSVFREGNIPSLVEEIKELVTQPEKLKILKDTGHHYVKTELTHEAVSKNLARHLLSSKT